MKQFFRCFGPNIRMTKWPFFIVLLWPGAKGSRPPPPPGLKRFCLGCVCFCLGLLSLPALTAPFRTIDFPWNGFIFDFQTSRYHHFNRNFEPDPFLRSRRSQNGQNRAKNAFVDKKLIFLVWNGSTNALLIIFRAVSWLLDLKNGSGSKLYTGKWYSEVWKRKIKLFHDPGKSRPRTWDAGKT